MLFFVKEQQMGLRPSCLVWSTYKVMKKRKRVLFLRTKDDERKKLIVHALVILPTNMVISELFFPGNLGIYLQSLTLMMDPQSWK